MANGREKGSLFTWKNWNPEGRRKRTGHFNRPKKRKGDPARARLPPGWAVQGAVVGVALSAGTAWLFYRSVWAMLLSVFLVPFTIKRFYARREERNRNQLKQQFLSFMQSVSGLLQAGYSIENAWRASERDLTRLYGTDAIYVKSLRLMNQKLAINVPLEKVLSDYALSVDVEEILRFAEIFRYARRSGGNLTEIICNTVLHMQQKAEVLAEIENAVAARKMEQRMMNLLLPGILFFLTVSSPSYTAVLYHNAAGAFVMSICLAGYIFCLLWSAGITDIRV